MFEGEKSWVFWVGLVMLALASLGLFQILWSWIMHPYSYYSSDYWKSMVPFLVGTTIFILIGLYMMKSGAKTRTQPISPSQGNL